MSNLPPTSVVLFGIPNCDQVKRARNWLEQQHIPYHFHDFKKAGLTSIQVQQWLTQLDWSVLINKKGTTWRQLPDARKNQITDAEAAIALMLEMPSIIKRPVLGRNHQYTVGFSEAEFAQLAFFRTYAKLS